MQTETTAPAVDTTATAPAGQVTTTPQTTTTPPASGQDGAAGTSQPAGTAAPADGQKADQGTQQGQQGQADGTTSTDAERDEAGRFQSKVQKRINELTHARHAAEREAARWRAIAEGSQKAAPAPQAHEFASDAEYEAAARRHEIREAAREIAADQAKQAA